MFLNGSDTYYLDELAGGSRNFDRKEFNDWLMAVYNKNFEYTENSRQKKKEERVRRQKEVTERVEKYLKSKPGEFISYSELSYMLETGTSLVAYACYNDLYCNYPRFYSCEIINGRKHWAYVGKEG